jgi:hypothetical protein
MTSTSTSQTSGTASSGAVVAPGPSKYLQEAEKGLPEPVGTPPGDLYFTYTQPDGTTFINGAALAEGYLRLGYTVGGEQTLNDYTEWQQAVSPGSLAPPASGVEQTEATATAGVTQQAAPKSS